MDPNQEQAAPQGMLPPMNQPAPQMAPQAAPAGPPEASTSFDVQKNPQDMQFMTDAAMYAPMLKNMTEEQRAEKWPGIVDKLSQVSPKASTMLDPSLPPSDKDLDSLISKLPGNREGAAQPGMTQVADNDPSRTDYLNDQVKRQLNGNDPQTPAQYASEKAKEEQMKKAYRDARDPNKMSNAEFAFEAAQLAGKGGQYMTAAYGGSDGEGMKLPPGYMEDPNSPGQQTYIKGGPADPEVIANQAKSRKQATAPTEGQVAVAKAAENLLPLIKKLPFNDDYTLDRQALALPKVGVINEKGTMYDDATTKVAQAFMRLITGATAPDKEVEATKKMIACGPLDTPDICAQKYIFAETFYKNLTSLQKEDKSTLTGKTLDVEKAQALQDKAKTSLILYKDKWMTKQQQQYPDASLDDLNRLWTKSIMTSPEFVQKVTADMNKEGK